MHRGSIRGRRSPPGWSWVVWRGVTLPNSANVRIILSVLTICYFWKDGFSFLSDVWVLRRRQHGKAFLSGFKGEIFGVFFRTDRVKWGEMILSQSKQDDRSDKQDWPLIFLQELPQTERRRKREGKIFGSEIEVPFRNCILVGFSPRAKVSALPRCREPGEPTITTQFVMYGCKTSSSAVTSVVRILHRRRAKVSSSP